MISILEAMEEENKFIALLGKHWSKLLLGLLVCACLAAWSERFLRADTKQSKHDFVVVNQIFDQFQKGGILPVESIESAENILARHPELHPKYDPMLAHTFFSQAKGTQGMKYAQSIIQQVDSELPPLYKQYAYTTLLISAKNYSQAFEDSLALQERLTGQRDYQILEAMNLLRLLFLAERLGDTTQKNIFWKKLEHHPAYLCIQPLFQEGSLSLSDYVNRTRVKP
jgi:hypothetical protein